MGITPVILEGFDFTVFGLPAHPLVVHAVVVLVPLSALAFILTAWRREWRELYLLPISLMAAASAIAAFIAKETGESLEEAVKETGKRLGEHPEQGDVAFIITILFGLCAVGSYAVLSMGPEIRRRLGLEDRMRLPVSDGTAAYLITLPFAIAATAYVIIAGHSGAELVWKTL
ncbi:MAG: DUF2231 domain-containing protein [Dehalococcoidia bacterium]